MANVLQDLSAELAVTVAAAGAYVVRVESRRRLAASGVVWSADGVIVTARHVLRERNRVQVGLPDGAVVPAEVAGHDSSTDLAVLKAEASGLTAATWSSEPAVGNLALALGRPGQSVQATLGIISALGEKWRTPAGGEVDRYLQTDVVMYPGFSGGPLVGANGVAYGVNSSALLRGISISLPVGTVRSVVEAVLAHGKVRRGYLGINTQPVRLPEALATALGQETGLLVAGVEPDSPAEKGGLLLGDTILSFDGARVRSHDDLMALLSGERVGKKLPMGILRGGEERTLNISAGERA
jgi:S1-C subfamily serine protease